MADLKSIYKKLSSKPLQGEELDRWYVDTAVGRGHDPVEIIANLNNPANSASAPES